MKKIFFFFSVLFPLSSWASISIITDLDDTLKITNSGQEIEATMNGLFSDKVFTGMPEFIKATRAYVDQVHILTASPLIIRPVVQNVLKKRNIEVDSLIMKNPFLRQENIDFKIMELKKLFDKSSDDFILIGDDVGHDPEAYEIIKNLYPGRVLAVYIHAIQGRSLPKSSFQYWTAFDLFLKEFLAGRMIKSSVDEVIETLYEEKNLKLIFPGFAKCPKTPEVWSWQVRSIFVRQAFTLAGKFNLYCISRSSGI